MGPVPALAAKPVRLEDVALVAVALVPRLRHLATQLGAGTPPAARLCFHTAAQIGVELLTGGTGAAVAVRRILAGKRTAVERGGAVVLGTEQALVGAVAAIRSGVAEAVHGDALGLVQ